MGRDGRRQVTLDFRLLRQYHQRLLALGLLCHLQFQLAQFLQTNHLQTVGNHHRVDGGYHCFVEYTRRGETVHQCLVEGVKLLNTRALDEIHQFHQTIRTLSRRKDGSRIANRQVSHRNSIRRNFRWSSGSGGYRGGSWDSRSSRRSGCAGYWSGGSFGRSLGNNLGGAFDFRYERHILAIRHITPTFGLHAIGLYEDTFRIELCQFALCRRIATQGRCLHIHQCLVVVDGQAVAIHITRSQSVFCLGMALTGSTLEPHRC